MRVFRTLPAGRLLALLAAALAVVVAGTIAVAARGGSSATPPEKPLANAIHDALAAQAPAGITARIHFTNNLFPSGALTGQTGSALMSSASGRLWLNDNGGRLELQSNGGDAQITWTDSKLTVFDASSNTAYVADLPKATQQKDTGSLSSLDEITRFLTDAAVHWSISAARPSNVAGQEAYTVSVSPKQDGGLLGSAELAWDALHGTPLKVAVYARGDSSPVLALEATDISFGSVPDGDVLVSPPASAKVVDLSHAHDTTSPGTSAVPGLPAPPDSLDGRSRSDLRSAGDAQIAAYGEGLDSIVVVERKADASAKGGGPLGSLPEVKLDGVTAHELSTPLGTAVTWDTGGVTYVVAGSVTAATAESAARALR